MSIVLKQHFNAQFPGAPEHETRSCCVRTAQVTTQVTTQVTIQVTTQVTVRAWPPVGPSIDICAGKAELSGAEQERGTAGADARPWQISKHPVPVPVP